MDPANAIPVVAEEAGTWASLFQSNRSKSPGGELRYIPPAVTNGVRMVTYHSDDIAKEAEKWRFALVGSVLEENPQPYKFEKFSFNRWERFGLLTVHLLRDNLFLLNFDSEKGKLQVLNDETSTFNKKPVVLREWQPRANFNVEPIQQASVWVKLPALPIEFWSIEILSKIGSICGRPKHIDKCTLNRTKLQYARLCVVMDVKGEFPDMVELMDEHGEKFSQKIVYEWKPSFCTTCDKFGHETSKCKVILRKEWKPKSGESVINTEVLQPQRDATSVIEKGNLSPGPSVATHQQDVIRSIDIPPVVTPHNKSIAQPHILVTTDITPSSVVEASQSKQVWHDVPKKFGSKKKNNKSPLAGNALTQATEQPLITAGQFSLLNKEGDQEESNSSSDSEGVVVEKTPSESANVGDNQGLDMVNCDQDSIIQGPNKVIQGQNICMVDNIFENRGENSGIQLNSPEDQLMGENNGISNLETDEFHIPEKIHVSEIETDHNSNLETGMDLRVARKKARKKPITIKSRKIKKLSSSGSIFSPGHDSISSFHVEITSDSDIIAGNDRFSLSPKDSEIDSLSEAAEILQLGLQSGLDLVCSWDEAMKESHKLVLEDIGQLGDKDENP